MERPDPLRHPSALCSPAPDGGAPTVLPLEAHLPIIARDGSFFLPLFVRRSRSPPAPHRPDFAGDCFRLSVLSFIRKSFLYGPIANSVTAAALQFGKYRSLIRIQDADPFLSSSVVPVCPRHRTVRILQEVASIFPLCLFIRILYGPIATAIPLPRCAPAGSGVCRRRLRRAGHRRASRRAVPPRRTDRKRPDGKS